MYNMQLHL